MSENIVLDTGKKIFFASDFHLGVPNESSSREREKRIVSWLDSIKKEASEIFLVGDVFDFWFEYSHVIPKGFSRLIGKLCELQDSGIQIHLFHGNHDLWQFGYFQREIGCLVHPGPINIKRNNHQFYIGHGDGLGPGQRQFKMILWIYRNHFFQKLFSLIHPDIGIAFANWFSHRSKQKTFSENKNYLGDDKEHLMLHAQELLKSNPLDYFIFGHRHLPFQKQLKSAVVVNLGDWFSHNTYAVFDGNNLELKSYPAS